MSNTSRASASRGRRGPWLLALGVAVALGVAFAAARGPAPPRREPRIGEGHVVLDGTLHAAAYATHPRRYHGHHAVTWRGGSMSSKALIRSDVPDRRVAEVLAGMGIADGGGLPEEAWSNLGDPDAREPDRRASGGRLRVEVRWEGSGDWRPLEELLRDRGEPARLDLRFVDNRRWISHYGSGCVVCLASCPGSKIANRGYTMRQNQSGAMRYEPVPGLPEDGTPVEVRITPEARETPPD